MAKYRWDKDKEDYVLYGSEGGEPKDKDDIKLKTAKGSGEKKKKRKPESSNILKDVRAEAARRASSSLRHGVGLAHPKPEEKAGEALKKEAKRLSIRDIKKKFPEGHKKMVDDAKSNRTGKKKGSEKTDKEKIMEVTSELGELGRKFWRTEKEDKRYKELIKKLGEFGK